MLCTIGRAADGANAPGDRRIRSRSWISQAGQRSSRAPRTASAARPRSLSLMPVPACDRRQAAGSARSRARRASGRRPRSLAARRDEPGRAASVRGRRDRRARLSRHPREQRGPGARPSAGRRERGGRRPDDARDERPRPDADDEARLPAHAARAWAHREPRLLGGPRGVPLRLGLRRLEVGRARAHRDAAQGARRRDPRDDGRSGNGRRHRVLRRALQGRRRQEAGGVPRV